MSEETVGYGVIFRAIRVKLTQALVQRLCSMLCSRSRWLSAVTSSALMLASARSGSPVLRSSSAAALRTSETTRRTLR